MVSVCIATYNGEKYIKDEINSILPQLDNNDEIVISDDGSSDNTIPILLSYHDNRIRILNHKKQKTKYKFDYTTHNFENALINAKGEYIFLADQDDVWFPDKVKTCLASLQDSDIVVSDCCVVDKDLVTIQKSRFETFKPNSGFIKNIISAGNPGCCVAFKKTVLNTVLPFPKYGVAHDFWIVVFGGMYHTVSYIRQPLIMFRRHDNNVSASMGVSNDSIAYKIKYRLEAFKAVIKRAGIIRVLKHL